MKSFKQYLTEMFPLPIAAETCEVDKIEFPKNIPNFGYAGQIKSTVKFEIPQKEKTTIAAPIAGYDRDAIKATIKQDESAGNEKKILKVYTDSKGKPTIAHGHLITAESPKIFTTVFADEHKTNPNFGKDVLSGKTELTTDQTERLLDYDLDVRMGPITKAFPKFGTYSSDLQSGIASGWWTGMLPQSKNTISLINSGKWDEAGKEFINAKEYRNPSGKGIRPRMDRLANTFRTEPTRQKKPAK